METIVLNLTVFFEDPFWVALYEREYQHRLEVCKVPFGSQPKDYEVYEFFLKHWHQLRFSPSVELAAHTHRVANPKRMQRAIKKQLCQTGIGTKAQQALKLQQEQGKHQRRMHSHQQHEAAKERQFQLRQQKRREKHRGH